jgi:predicted dehydrogenase
MAKKLGALVQGAGWVSGEHIKAYLGNPNTELVAVNSRLQSELDEKQATYGLDCELTVDSYEKLLARDDIDVVSICTINFLHTKEAVMALEAGKHVLIEKPICISLEELRQLRDAYEKAYAAGARAQAGFVARWYPLFQAIRSIVDRGLIGDVYYAASDYWHEVHGEWKTKPDLAGSSLLMGGCHSVDAIRWYAGSGYEYLKDADPELYALRNKVGEVVEVHGYTVPPVHRPDFEYDPNTFAMLQFANGALGKVGSSVECNMPYVFNLELMGNKGAVRNDEYWTDEIAGVQTFLRIPVIRPDNPDVTHHPFNEEIDHFIDCLVSGKANDADLWHAIGTHEVVFAIDESAKTGKPVTLPIL